MKNTITKTSLTQNILRIALGLAMFYAGIGHLTFLRTEFQAQVPLWISENDNFMDFIVLASGIVEIIFGILMVIGGKLKVKTGIALAIFYILIFPGNINQYIHQIDAFGLNTDNQRLIRLFFQPVLILWALWSTGAIKHLKHIFKRNNNGNINL